MKFLEGNTVGIDLGTTYSAVSQLSSDGDPQVLPNADDRTITPSVILLGDEGRVLVGPSRERISIEDPKNVVEAVKRQMGNKNYFVVYQGKKLTPEFLAALILKKLKQDAEQQIGPIANAVVTVPYYFNDVRRKATQDAGRVAGMNVIDIINEPTAATLAYAWSKGELGRIEAADAKPKTILVYDLGGGTFDVTVVSYTSTHFRVLATDGDVMLGGLDWSNRLVDHLAEQFTRKHGEDPRSSPESIRSFFQECEDAKRELSNKAQTPVTVYHKGKTLTVALTRNDFERMTGDLLQRTKDTTELVLQQSEVDPRTLDEVVLIGGSTYMPIVENMLREICGRVPSRALMPEEAVAQGAAIHAAILEARHRGEASGMSDAILKRLRSVNTADVNSHSLGVKASPPKDPSRKINHIMIPRNTTIPFSKRQKFVTNSDNQRSVHIYVLEGEAEDPDACTMVGDFQLVDLPEGLPKGTPVEVTYRYDNNGRIHAEAKELKGNREAKTVITRDSGLDDDGVAAFTKLASEYKVD
ncbi:Hsp70 family protein [Stratiformator vulcanicus]|uniref:Chaperone protein DnaK n=1 Tax=Stratiformator vulcanicus TaxID=2527980 RepID=A0A517R388_9PLAN|nr:Hsp70 family protein [Stratiformator vulcanicus]QDT38340.1 Chaperone protein DnaK [Stratiformator vulcanicus]